MSIIKLLVEKFETAKQVPMDHIVINRSEYEAALAGEHACAVTPVAQCYLWNPGGSGEHMEVRWLGDQPNHGAKLYDGLSVRAAHALAANVLAWWREAEFMLTGDYGESNVFDTKPDFVIQAEELLGIDEIKDVNHG